MDKKQALAYSLIRQAELGIQAYLAMENPFCIAAETHLINAQNAVRGACKHLGIKPEFEPSELGAESLVDWSTDWTTSDDLSAADDASGFMLIEFVIGWSNFFPSPDNRSSLVAAIITLSESIANGRAFYSLVVAAGQARRVF
jgi:hypothetical protein